MVHVHTASIQDRDGAVDLLKELGEKFPNLRHVMSLPTVGIGARS